MGATISRERTRCASMLTSPQTTGKPRRASVDPALAFDEVPQRLVQVLFLPRTRNTRDHLLRIR